MPLASAANLREWFDIVSDVKDARLSFCLSAAERQLKSWVGSDNYEDEDLAETMEWAEAHLAVYHLLLNTGARIRRNGLVKQEQDAGGSVTNSVINEYYTSEELQRLREQYFKTAVDEVEEYRTAEATGNAASLPIRPWWAVASEI